MDGRVKKARMNVISTMVNQLVATLCGLAIPWIMIDTFGSDAYGATTSIAQFLAYISLLEGGIGRVARGALYQPLAQQDVDGISRVYLAVKRFFCILGMVFAGYTVVLAAGYHTIADVSIFTWDYTFMLVLCIAIGKFAEYMGGISNVTLFNADQRQYVVNTVYIVTNVLNVALVLVLAKLGADLIWVKLISSLVFVLRPLIYTYYRKKHYTIRKTQQRFKLPNRLVGIAQHTAYVVQNNTDVLILTVFSDLKMVAVYTVYHLVTFSMRNVVTSFTGGMEALLGNMFAKGEEDALRNAYRTYKLILTVLTVVLFGVTAMLIVPFVGLYTAGVEDADYQQPVFALILVMAEALNCLVLPCFNLSIAANKLKESQIGAYVEAGINLVVSIALVFWNPLVGVALGTLAATLFKCVYYIAFSGKHILKMKVSRMLGELGITTAVLVAISLLGMMAVWSIAVYSYGVWALCGVVCALAAGAVSVILGAILYPDRLKSAVQFLLKRPIA